MESRNWEIITTLLRLSHTVEAGLTRHLRPYGIAFTDLRLMLMVVVSQGVSQKDLATQMRVSQVVVSTRLDKLERAGLVTRSHVGHRRVSVRPTETGIRLLNLLLHSVLRSAPGRAIELLTPTQADNVLQSIRVLVSSMRVPLQKPIDPSELLNLSQLPDVICDRLDQSRVVLEEHVVNEREWMNGALQSLEREIGMLVEAFKILQAKQDLNGQSIQDDDSEDD
jgi:DNA-binding MarR family transcriptional regulator